MIFLKVFQQHQQKQPFKPYVGPYAADQPGCEAALKCVEYCCIDPLYEDSWTVDMPMLGMVRRH